jgi:hypothetical protein
MVLFLERKRPCLILAALLVFAVTGTFTFAEAEFFRSVDFEAPGSISGGFFSPVDYTVDCLAAGGAVISRAGGYSFSPPRGGSPHGTASPGIPAAVLAFSLRSLNVIKHTYRINIKSAILLKLRI